MATTFETLIFWYQERPQILWSVILPSLLCLAFILAAFFSTERRQWKHYAAALLISAGVGFEFSWWRVSDDMIQLQGLQIPIFMVAYLMLLDIDVSPGMAYLLTFLSDLLVDFFQAAWFHPFFSTEFDTEMIFKIMGIGGAGLGDGLFIYPLIAATIAGYNRKFNHGRRGNALVA